MKNSLQVAIGSILLSAICIVFSTKAYVMDLKDSEEPTSYISIKGVDQKKLYQALYDHAAENGYRPHTSALDPHTSALDRVRDLFTSFKSSAKADAYNRKVEKFLSDHNMASLGGAGMNDTLCVKIYDQRYGSATAQRIYEGLLSETNRQEVAVSLFAQLQREASPESRVDDGLSPCSAGKDSDIVAIYLNPVVGAHEKGGEK